MTVVVGAINQTHLSQPFRSCVVVEVVHGCDGGLSKIRQVDVAPQVVNGYGDVKLKSWLNQSGCPVCQTTTAGVQRRGQRQLDGVCFLVDPLLVEAEATAGVGVGARQRIKR